MAARVRLMINEAEGRVPVGIRLAVPAVGLGERLDHIYAWLDQNAGADGWAMTPCGIRTVVDDAIAVYFAEAPIASAFVAPWCAGSNAETMNSPFRIPAHKPA